MEQRITKLDWKSTMYSVVKYPKIFIFMLLCLILYWFLVRKVAGSIYNMGTIRKILLCNFHLEMVGVHYTFTYFRCFCILFSHVLNILAQVARIWWLLCLVLYFLYFHCLCYFNLELLVHRNCCVCCVKLF